MLLPLKARTLRVSLTEPKTEYRWYSSRKCGAFNMFTCWDVEHIENDFDFTKAEDRIKFFTIGFECRVRDRL
jgi:hypothetical protein